MPSRYAQLLCLVLLDVCLVSFQQCLCTLIVIANLFTLSLVEKLFTHAVHVLCSEAICTNCGRRERLLSGLYV